MLELSLLETFARESSIEWNFSSLELSFTGTFAPGAKVLWIYSSPEIRSLVAKTLTDADYYGAYTPVRYD